MALASGLPVICIGHRQSPLIEVAKDYRLGIILTDSDTNTMAETLKQGLEDFSRFAEYRKETLRCAENEVNAERNRQQLHQLLAAAQKTNELVRKPV